MGSVPRKQTANPKTKPHITSLLRHVIIVVRDQIRKSSITMNRVKKRFVRHDRPKRKGNADTDDALNSFANILEKSQAAVNEVDGPVAFSQAAGSDDDEGAVDTVAHKRLVTALGQLHRGQHIKVPTRTEISERRGEFDLVKSHADDVIKPLEAKVTLSGLVDTLQKNKKHGDVSKELIKLQKTSKKLAKPLEKPVAERLARTLAYEKAVSELDRWESVVEKNKVEETIHFPLIDDTAVKLADSTPREPLSYRIKSNLMTEMEKLDPVKEVVTKSEKAARNQRLKEELKDQRKELARLRRKESYEIEKARRQNKIKSKKYHRVLKKERLKKQLADFEELKKVDPEAVLVELEKIEKARVEERAHQRHRNTGTWAKNLQVRAKFDREARDELTTQIEIGKELTRKQVDQDEEDDDESDGGEEEQGRVQKNPFNPWMKAAGEDGDENNEEYSGYRKYWETRNKDQEAMKEYMENSEGEDDDDEVESGEEEEEVNGQEVKNEENSESEDSDDEEESNDVKVLDNGFQVHTLDDIFEPLEDEETISEKIASKLERLRKKAGIKDDNKKDRKRNKNPVQEERPNQGLEFKKKATLADADEEMNESANGQGSGNKSTDDIKNLRNLLATQEERQENADGNNKTEEQINPNKFMALEPRHLKTALPDSWNDEEVEGGSDNEEGEDVQRMTIAEAFEDDDIVMDFKQEKEDRVKADQPEDINLTLPGWGAWTGSGVSEKEQQKKRMVLKFPKELPRKDDRKDKLILNEAVPDKLKEHLVSQLPFPFHTVSDYESSIRAPISRSFVPETAHRALTKPSVTTRLGKIIEPMDEHTLLQAEMPTGKRRTKSSHKLADSRKKKLKMTF